MSPDPVAAVLSVTLGFAKDGFIPTPLIVLAVDILLTLARVKPEALVLDTEAVVDICR
jgi:hypothetical protein